MFDKIKILCYINLAGGIGHQGCNVKKQFYFARLLRKLAQLISINENRLINNRKISKFETSIKLNRLTN